MKHLLEVSHVHSGYGKIEVLKGVSVSVPEGRIVSLVGSNGAGKSTLLMTLSGILRLSKGSIRFDSKPIHNDKPDAITRLGVIQVPEGRRVFKHLTVEENLKLGAYSRVGDPDEKSRLEEMLALFPILKNRFQSASGNLSGGEQQMLAMARALMAKPRLLLLDEPSLGLAPKMVETVFELIRKVNKRGLTVLLVEQNTKKALEISDRAYVLENGRIELEGSGHELLTNPKVKQAYLGC